MEKVVFSCGMKVEIISDGTVDWEAYNEIEQAGLAVGDIVTIEDYDSSDHSVRVFESISNVWISGYHFKILS